MSTSKTYEDAIKCFNKMYPKQDYVETPEDLRRKIPRMYRYLEVLGITLDDIDNLNIIHVTGTKGKGSTCTFTESILRQHGYKTGCIISPHLIEIRERTQINGCSLDKATYTKHFFAVHNKLLKIRDVDGEVRPTFFAFHVLMSLHVFVEEKIDACVIEVGVGGEYDFTNFIRRPVACGITMVDLDHTDKLGNTKESIAWHKSGIFKPGSIAFTGSGQQKSVMEVFRSRAEEKGIPVYCVPDLASYETEGKEIILGIPGATQLLNASLALQLANAWLNRHNRSDHTTSIADDHSGVIPTYRPFTITQPMLKGLKEASIMCRAQCVKKPGLTYYIDGAHTVDSMQQCVDWFTKEADKETKEISGKSIKVLMFNLTGKRDAHKVLLPLSVIDFDAVVFFSNNIYPGSDVPDRVFAKGAFEIHRETCLKNMKAWHTLKGTAEMKDEVFHCIRDALYWATQGREPGLLDEPKCALAPLMDITDGTTHGFEKGIKASKLDLAKPIPPHLQEADHIQILVTGGMWSTGGALKLIRDESK